MWFCGSGVNVQNMMKLGSTEQWSHEVEVEVLIKENQFSDFYIFRCSGIVLLFSNGLIT